MERLTKAEYIERAVTIKAVVGAVDSGLATNSEDLEEVIGDLLAADVVQVEELAKRDQEIKRLQAEVDRLHKENFWLTSGRRWEPAWIAMVDKPPEEDGSYIVCTKLGAVCTAHFNVKTGRWGHSLYGVTHWMPRPKAPGKEDADGTT